MGYSFWASELVNHYFGRHSEGMHVRLMIDASVLDRDFSNLGGFDGFLSDINTGPEWIQLDGLTRSIDDSARALYKQWKGPAGSRPAGYPDLPDNAPPFIPYLCLMALTWTIDLEGDATANAFYNRLDKICPNHHTRTRLPFWTDNLWGGLEAWSNELNGRRGIFKTERLGKMAHVGLPKSQVILPPHKIDHLPYLLWHSHLRPEDAGNLNTIHEALSHDESLLTQRFGSQLSAEIRHRSDLGKSALKLIADFMAEWDGQRPAAETSSGTHDGFSAPRIATSRLNLVMKYNQSHRTWEILLGLIDNDVAGGKIQLDSDGPPSLFQRLHPRLVVVEKEKDNAYDPFLEPEQWSVKAIFEATVENDESGDNDFLTEWSPKGIYIFSAASLIPPDYFPESDALPTRGPCYFLISPSAVDDWKRWLKTNASVIKKYQGLPRAGIPSGYGFECIENVENIPRSIWDDLSLESVAKTRANLFSIIGGTRVRIGGFRKTYVYYDMPTVIIHQQDVHIKVMGANLNIRPPSETSVVIPGEYAREATLDIENDAGIITMEAKDCYGNVQTTSFGIYRSGSIMGDAPAAFISIDSFGWPVTKRGLRGVNIDWAGKKKPCSNYTPNNDLQSHFLNLTMGPPSRPVNRFIDMLGCRGGRMTFAEARKKAEDLCETSRRDFNREIRFLRDLAYIDVLVDEKGRWREICANQPYLYRLPSTYENMHVVTLTGCMIETDLTKLLLNADKMNITTLHKPIGNYSIIPPSLYFFDEKLSALEQLVVGLPRLKLHCEIPAHALACWSGNIGVWEEDILSGWQEGPGRDSAEGEYIPSKFRSMQGRSHPAPFRLQFLEDPVTGKHKIYKVLRNSICEGFSHCYIRDPAWAKWRCQNAITDEWSIEGVADESETTPIFYSQEKMELYLPRLLTLPYVLARALTCCSGFPPEPIPVPNPYTDVIGDFIHSHEQQGYKDTAWRYSCVPEDLAKLILSKLRATPIEREKLTLTHL